MVKNPPAMWDTWVGSLGWEDPLEKENLPTPVFWPRESHGQRSLAGLQRTGHDWATFISLSPISRWSLDLVNKSPRLLRSSFLIQDECNIHYKMKENSFTQRKAGKCVWDDWYNHFAEILHLQRASWRDFPCRLLSQLSIFVNNLYRIKKH